VNSIALGVKQRGGAGAGGVTALPGATTSTALREARCGDPGTPAAAAAAAPVVVVVMGAQTLARRGMGDGGAARGDDGRSGGSSGRAGASPRGQNGEVLPSARAGAWDDDAPPVSSSTLPRHGGAP
jgi:hypothetical protein